MGFLTKIKSGFIAAVVILAGTLNSYGQGDVSFLNSTLIGANVTNPTSLQFGPDGRLYVAQQNGMIYAFTIFKSGPQNYSVLNTESITAVKNIPNHNDDGSLNTSEQKRQVTGILVVGTAENPVLYVGSSDWRIGGGGDKGDINLDTNSGIISKLTKNGNSWDKVDVVVGLPRSEENHANNGMQLDEANNILYVASGGSTNAGSPSTNFAYITEYALSAAILAIDLDKIENDHGGSYIIPTLDDPSRPNNPDGSDVNDPFGGNDGLNQGKLELNGPISIHSPGYRNIYDIVLTKTAGMENRLYTIDNGPNGGWGGHPKNEGTPNVTNEYVIGEPGSNGPGPNDAKVNNKDNLHLVSKPGMTPIYGGHPNPLRANPNGAGLYWRDDADNEFFDLSPTVDWPPYPPSLANLVEGDYRNPGVDDGALYTWAESTNGMVEYTSPNVFGGVMQGDILAVSFDNNLYRIKFTPNGENIQFVESIASGFAQTPLDVTAQGPGQIFEGTIWTCNYVSDDIVVLEPDSQDSWEFISSAPGNLEQRHENSAVEVDGKFYIIGGRGNKSIDIYDPSNNTWSKGAQPPLEINHFQAVTYGGKIYVAAAFTGAYPTETPVGNILIYDPVTNQWSNGPAIPRARGSAGALVYEDALYLFSGITNGHTDGWVNWVDKYDFITEQWEQLANAPRARDHIHVGFINGKVYLAGGRQSNAPNGVYKNTIDKVDVYDIASDQWSTLPFDQDLPTERAGAAAAVLNGELYIIGGESSTQTPAHSEVEVYNPNDAEWRDAASPNTARHGTQAIVYQGSIYIPAGSANRGGGPEQNTMEQYSLGIVCTGADDPNLDEDGDLYSNADEIDAGSNPCNAASIPVDYDGDYISNVNDDDDDNDGIPDTSDKFALDPSNGLDYTIPITYPFLNGDPGEGLFGLGFTGLMTNGVTDYEDLYDAEAPDLIMGGAVGLASFPANAGDARTDNNHYGFQYGFGINPSDGAFIISTRLQGAPFFDGIALGSLDDQIQGIFFGTGDQDNYIKIVLDANFGDPGFTVLGENNGSLFTLDFDDIPNILDASYIDLFISVDPVAKTATLGYETPSSGGQQVISADVALPSGFNTILEGTEGAAVGLIASAGSGPDFSTSYDFLNVQPGKPYVEDPRATYLFSSSASNGSVDLHNIFEDDKGDNNLSYNVQSVSSNTIIANFGISNGNLNLDFANEAFGQATFTIRATDSDGLFEEFSFTVLLAAPTVPIININAGGGAYTSSVSGITWDADKHFSGGQTYEKVVETEGTVDDALFWTERYGSFTYNIPVPQDDFYKLEILLSELYWGVAKQPGDNSRLFNIDVEGQYQLTDVDIFSEAGGANKALTKVFDLVEVLDGNLTIQITKVKDNGKISAIQVSSYVADASGSPPIVQNPGNQNTFEGAAFSLQIQATDPDPTDQLTYEATGLPTSLLIDDQTGLITGTIEADANTYPVEVTVTDKDNQKTSVNFDIVILPNSSTFTLRINAGGDQFIANNELWEADNYFAGTNRTYATTASLGTPIDPIYQSERFGGNFTYAIPVPSDGDYQVTLLFSENYWGLAGRVGPGKRVFDVLMEGNLEIDDLDIFAAAGAALTPYDVSTTVTVTDGTLNLAFSSTLDKAKIAGIVVTQLSSSGGQNPVIDPVSDVVVAPGESLNIPISATDDGTVTWTESGLPPFAMLNDLGGNTASITGTPGAGDVGQYPVTIFAKDDQDNETFVEFQITVFDESGSFSLRINSGGSQFTNGSEIWEADNYFSGTNRTYSTNNSIGTPIDPVYQTERFGGNFSYAIPVPVNGTYEVTLLFSENYWGLAGRVGPGKRVFDILMEGNLEIDDLDIFVAAGAALTAYDVTRTVDVNDGVLNLAFSASLDKAKIAGISVTQVSSSGDQVPAISTVADVNITPGESLNIPLSAIDEGSVTWSESGLPAFASLNDLGGNSASITGTPGPGDVNTYNVTVFAEDGSGQTGQESFQIVVSENPVTQDITFTLMNSSTNQPIAGYNPITNGALINVADVPLSSLNIRANTTLPGVESMVFEVQGVSGGAADYNRTESSAPYAVFGDNAGNYYVWKPNTPQGGYNYALTATAYDANSGNGSQLGTATISFSFGTSAVDCNGDVNGTAALDECGICSGGNTGVDPCTPPPPPPADCNTFVESNGLVVIEVESAEMPNNTYYVGTGPVNGLTVPTPSGEFIMWRSNCGEGPDYEGCENVTSANESNAITYNVEFTSSGRYKFEARTWQPAIKYPGEAISSSNNDFWVEFPEGIGLMKKGADEFPFTDWLKVYQSVIDVWQWDTKASSPAGTARVFIDVPAPGVYQVKIAGRSALFAIDRLVLYKFPTTPTQATTAMPPQSEQVACEGSTINDELASIEDVTGESINVYPNPFNDIFTLTFGSRTGARMVRVYDMSGRIVYENADFDSTARSLPINMGTQPPGVYQVVVGYEDSTQTVRVLKQ